MNPMRLAIVADHGGFALNEQRLTRLHETIDFGTRFLDPDDDDPDVVLPLARAVAAGKIQRPIAICGSGVGAAVCANKVAGVRAALIHGHFSPGQGVQDAHMHVRCLGGRTEGPAIEESGEGVGLRKRGPSAQCPQTSR